MIISEKSSEHAKISIVIASKGRPEILNETLQGLQKQTLQPGKIVVVVPAASDLPELKESDQVQRIIGPLGSSVQRNEGIKVIPLSTDYVAFFDDDVELKPDYLEQAVAFLDANVGIVGFSGLDLAGPQSVSREEARRMLAAFVPPHEGQGIFVCQGKHFILYGCNMVIRRGVLEDEKFDERLPLYSYGEDYDLTMRLLHYGRVGRFSGSVGVHLQTKSGRVREVQRGYSQVANNWYFLKKGTVHLPPRMAWIRFWTICVGKNVLLCLVPMLKGDRSADFSGRLKGHLLGVWDILRGRSAPERVREL